MSKKNGIIVANWKMNFTLSDVKSFFDELKIPPTCSHKISIAPQTALLSSVKTYTDKNHINLAAQNCSTEAKGAFTGESSAETLQSVGVSQVILGHSERRQYFAENEEQLAKKIEQALKAKLSVIYCIGETLIQRSAGQLQETLLRQLKPLEIFKNNAAWPNLILAYEPVWAIGTGQVATLDQVQEVHQFLINSFKSAYPQFYLSFKSNFRSIFLP